MSDHRTKDRPSRRPKTGFPALALVLSIGFLATLPSRLPARTTGAVEGLILDVENHRPLEGVSVTVSGPALPGSYSTTTGRDGRFRCLGLPPGTYFLEAHKAGYSSLEQTHVQIELHRTVTLTLEMLTALDDDEVTITGSAPVLDITSAVTGDLFDLDLFDHIPLDRELRDLPESTPEVVPAADLGGPFSIAGGAPRDNLFRLDGLDVTSPFTGEAAVTLAPEQVARVEVATGGREAERDGTLGGVVQILTREGGPEHHGRLSLYGRDRGLSEPTPATVTAGRDRGTSGSEAGFALGGPVVARRLWYFAAADRMESERFSDNRQGERFEERRDSVPWSARLTWQPADPFLLTAAAFGTPTTIENEPVPDAAGRLAQNGDTGTNGWIVEGHGALERTLFVEAHAGRLVADSDAEPLDDVPFYEDLTADGRWAKRAGCGPRAPLGAGTAFAAGCLGGTVARSRGQTRRDEATALLNWFSDRAAAAGQGHGGVEHSVRLGVDWRRTEIADDTRFPGPSPDPLVDSSGALVDPSGLTGQRWLLSEKEARLYEIEGSGDRHDDRVAVFAEDRIRFGQRAVLRLGLRAERLSAALRTGVGGDPSDPVLSFDPGDTIAPRVSLVWDLRGDGRSRFFAHYGSYIDPSATVGRLPLASRRWNVYTFGLTPDGALPTAENPGTLLDSRSLARALAVAPDLRPPRTTEARMGLELEPLPNLTLGLSAVLRQLEEAVEDVSLDGGETYVVINPGGALTADPVTGEPLPSLVAFPHPQRNYEALEVRVDKGFGNGWQFHGSYTYAESDGNYGAAVPPPDGVELTPDFDSRFDLPGTVPQGEGKLVGDRRHQWRVYGSYRWSSKLTAGVFARYLSGAPFARLGAQPVLGRRSRFVGAPDSGGRLPELWSLDLHLEYPLEAGGTTADLIAEVFNVTDRQEPVRVVDEWSLAFLESSPRSTEEPSQPAFGSALEYQRPRQLRLGVRLRW